MGALLRRAPANGAAHRSSVYEFGSIRVDLRGTEVTRNGKIVNLSAREFQLLRFLIEHRGETLSRDVLLRDVWGYGAKIYTRTVDMRIANLRQQLEDDPKQPKFILTVQGLGYKFRPDEEAMKLPFKERSISTAVVIPSAIIVAAWRSCNIDGARASAKPPRYGSPTACKCR